ncbi:alkaline phosphatase family protein [Pseudoxanthomonas daejeonensis]|uniref:Alkaline phosphatase family protein n=1 Tax=Pseudoxanthomonas daejeonensis TaxID=266062 RepID=A0ABQ6Z8U2_9GAMM|nr:ectonucleotide pyrophosphatase/phosphodiesterase [Pseudoxanthomonas daejeonensis]KAF1695900.1 alkaline phosphatase family protein [Pseudoxanthomonas daejeonensis]
MSGRLIRLASLVLLLSLSACAASPHRPRSPVPVAASEPALLLLVSIDGLRADALGRGDTPHLDRLAAGGVRAQWMRPSYPVLTFPNHYTLVTGLRPDHHGIVHNSMKDAQLGRFIVADQDAGRVPGWWQGVPLWTSAEQAGIATGVWAWPGASAPRDGLLPRYWHAFDAAVPLDTRVDEIAGWLQAADGPRPGLVAVYLENVDGAGHDHGPAAPETHAAIRAVDAALGALLARLDAAGLSDRTNVVVVSDHGMAEVPDGHYIAVEDMASMEEAEVVSIGQVIGLIPRTGHEAAVESRLVGRHPHYQCWDRAGIPKRLQYGSHPRIPPILCQMDEGWNALPRTILDRRDANGSHDRGAHGYDPDLLAMRAVFIAHGPAFREGAVLAPFDNVDVYPLLARLLGITAQPNDGDPATLAPALREP